MDVRQIVMLRHGQTDWNKEFRFQGHTDVPLNAEGERQALAAAARVRHWAPQQVWVSSLKRARRTACLILGQPETSFHVTDALWEIGFGHWEGQIATDLERNYGNRYRRWMDDPSSEIPDGGESFSHCMERMNGVLNEILHSCSERTLIVGHGASLRALLASALKLPATVAWHLKFNNCSFAGLEFWRGQFWLSFLNDSAHEFSSECGSMGMFF